MPGEASLRGSFGCRVQKIKTNAMRAHRRGKFPEQPERIEVATIFAIGLQRLKTRKSSTLVGGTGESSLHNTPAESGHQPQVLRSMGRK
jgi:hypothetical protein